MLAQLLLLQPTPATSIAARICAPAQAAFGRTFSGDAFIAQPPEVVFRDFLPGSTYSATLRLINRGYTRNSIRLLDVPAEVRACIIVVTQQLASAHHCSSS